MGKMQDGTGKLPTAMIVHVGNDKITKICTNGADTKELYLASIALLSAALVSAKEDKFTEIERLAMICSIKGQSLTISEQAVNEIEVAYLMNHGTSFLKMNGTALLDGKHKFL